MLTRIQRQRAEAARTYAETMWKREPGSYGGAERVGAHYELHLNRRPGWFEGLLMSIFGGES